MDKNINILIQFIYISQNKYTQTKLIDDLKSELGISLKKSTLSDILKNKDKIVYVPDSCDYRDRKAKYPIANLDALVRVSTLNQ